MTPPPPLLAARNLGRGSSLIFHGREGGLDIKTPQVFASSKKFRKRLWSDVLWARRRA